MDALALLCTLHADGPTTLARLRTAECTSLEHVIAHPTERVARWMRVNVATAERFQREARALWERIGSENAAGRGARRDAWAREDETGADEREPELAPRGRARAQADRVAEALSRLPHAHRATGASAPSPILEHDDEDGDRDAGLDRERARAFALAEASETKQENEPNSAPSPRAQKDGDPPAPGRSPGARDAGAPPPRSPAGREVLLARVLETWRAHDAQELATEADVDDVPAALPVSAAQLPSIPTHRIDGLDAECSLALAKVGIGTIEALAQCDALAIARATDMAFARVLRLRALARRVNALSPDVGASSVYVAVRPAPTSSAAELLGASASAADARRDARGPAGANSERVPERISPSERPPGPDRVILSERDFILHPAPREEGAGGPFA